MIGETVAHYRIESKLGSGGMGVVYKAEDTKLLRFVALKFLPPESAADAQSVERFRREARAASALNHPHICTIYEIGEHDGRPFIAMEFLDGQTLRQRIAGKPMPLDEILDQGAQIADALSAAHARGIIHRDIKSANVFISRENSAKVLDFGLAKVTHAPGHAGENLTAPPTATLDVSATALGSVAGTATYMSPEQIRGQDLDPRTDLFSFGAVLYEMATGRTPFTGDTTGVVFNSILNRPPTPPSRLNPAVPPKLEEIIHKALEKDRDLRYQSANELRSDLKRLKRDSDSATAVDAVSSAAIPARRRLRLLPFALALLIIAVLIGGFVLYRFSRPAPAPSTTNWEQLTFFTDSAVYPSLSPDGRMLAFIRGNNIFYGPGQVYVKLLPDGEPVELTHDSRMKLSPIFSPDGSRIAYGTVDPFDTWEVPVLGGQPRLMLPNSSSLTWIDGGKRLLFSEIKEGIHMVVVTANEGRGDSKPLYAPPSNRGMAHHSYLSPDGHSLLIVEMDYRGSFLPCQVIPWQGSAKPLVVGPPGGACTSAAWSPDGKWIYVTATQAGGTHIWRQRFPDGQPEQVTSGPAEEAGIAFAPDGKSFITSVGTQDNMVWIHDQNGDRQVATEGDALIATFSSDASRLYYLYSSGRKGASASPEAFKGAYELWVMDLETGRSERALPGYSMEWYSVSKDGKQVAFSASDQSNRSSLWIAATDHRTSPRHIVSSAAEDAPAFLPDGDVVLRASESGVNSLYRMHADGSDRHKIGPPRIFDFLGVSPDGRWAAVSSDGPDEQHSAAWYAIPLAGGAPVLLCVNLCIPTWDIHGDCMYLSIYGHLDLGTYALPTRRGSGLPDLPAKGFSAIDEWKKAKGSVFIPQYVDSAVSTSLYAYTRQSIRRNLYRISLP
jgi:serine/threonine protein kinase/Tol biopolymer transport system component